MARSATAFRQPFVQAILIRSRVLQPRYQTSALPGRSVEIAAKTLYVSAEAGEELARPTGVVQPWGTCALRTYLCGVGVRGKPALVGLANPSSKSQSKSSSKETTPANGRIAHNWLQQQQHSSSSSRLRLPALSPHRSLSASDGLSGLMVSPAAATTQAGARMLSWTFFLSPAGRSAGRQLKRAPSGMAPTNGSRGSGAAEALQERARSAIIAAICWGISTSR